MGIEVSDDEIRVMRYVDQLYGPELAALSDADLADVWPEPDLDPSRAPRA